MSSEILSQLDKLGAVRQFDAFPKTSASYQVRSGKGGFATIAVIVLCFLLVINDLNEFLWGEQEYEFSVDAEPHADLQLNVDLTVAMPCHFLSVDVRDAVGDRVRLSKELSMDGTIFDTRVASQTSYSSPTDVSRVVKYGRKSRGWFSHSRAKFAPTRKPVPNGPACRIYGSFETKKVTANLHITTLGHGYMSFEHTDHKLMNLSHFMNEFSFGPYYPDITQPLDGSVEVTDQPFPVYQYFLTVVPTTYVDAGGRKISTNQYAAHDYVKTVRHGEAVPGIFFKYEFDPLHLTLRERTTSLPHLLVRLAGVIGGVWCSAAFALRVLDRFAPAPLKPHAGEKPAPAIPTSSPALSRGNSGGWLGGGGRGAGWGGGGDGVGWR